MRRILFAGVSAVASLALLILAPVGFADPPAPPTAAATPAPPSPQNRKQLERELKGFVANVTGSLMSDDPVQLWRMPVCPVLAGLPADQGEQVFAHLERTVRALGIPLGDTGCQPNFQIIVTSQPEPTIDALVKSQPTAFGDRRALQSFINTARPVRIYYSARLIGNGTGAMNMAVLSPTTGAPGTGPVGTNVEPTGGYAGVGMDKTSPRFQAGAEHPLVSVVAVVDLNRVAGFDWGQIADYVAMTGLTRVNLDAKFGDAPTILRLFSAEPKDRPTTLSDWDRALLRELYTTSASERDQRFEVALRMTHDIMP